jgi:hypothetical protein
MAADAHCNFGFAGFGVTFDFLALGRNSCQGGDKQGGKRQQQFVHFAWTISPWWLKHSF